MFPKDYKISSIKLKVEKMVDDDKYYKKLKKI